MHMQEREGEKNAEKQILRACVRAWCFLSKDRKRHKLKVWEGRRQIKREIYTKCADETITP